MTELDTILARIDSGLDESLARLFALLRIPSISTDPAYAKACQNAAEWCCESLRSLGFDASVRPTPGHPVVLGQMTGSSGPHVLFYGHYDVQPVDPLEEWNSEPFQPELVEVGDEQQIRARGAADDKGQLMTFIEAIHAWMDEAGSLPVNVTVLLEGEEEIASANLERFLLANAKDVKADVALVCDTGMWDRQTPAIASMLRGLMCEEITVKGADFDLHSGMYGSAARNPIHVLAKILGALHDDNGRITISDFYKGVSPVSAEQKMQWSKLDFDEKEFLSNIGLYFPAGESTYTVLEQLWSRPTAEVNGIYGGYTGEGSKTVIPAQASAKVSFRLVGEQDPDAIRKAFHTFVRERLPADCTAEFQEQGSAPATSQAPDSVWMNACRRPLEDEWGREAALIGMGGSIPVVNMFKRHFGMDTVLIGFGLDDDRIHSPNEKYNLTSFHKGIRSWARVLFALGAVQSQ